jgi:hypothetical protein
MKSQGGSIISGRRERGKRRVHSCWVIFMWILNLLQSVLSISEKYILVRNMNVISSHMSEF